MTRLLWFFGGPAFLRAFAANLARALALIGGVVVFIGLTLWILTIQPVWLAVTLLVVLVSALGAFLVTLIEVAP